MPSTLLSLRNDDLALTVRDDGSFALQDLHRNAEVASHAVALQDEGTIDVGHVWLRTERSWCELYPARFRGRRDGSTLLFVMLGRLGQEVGYVRCGWRLDGPWAVCDVLEVDPRLPSLVFPPPLQSDALVVPIKAGELRSEPLPATRFWMTCGHLNMRFFAGHSGESSWIGVFDRGHADAGVMASALTAAPGWLKSLGQWEMPRAVRYRLLPRGHVPVARCFRDWARQRQLHRSLEEKIDAVPQVATLRGARLISFMQASSRHAARHEARLRPAPRDVPRGQPQVHVRLTHAQVSQRIAAARAAGAGNVLALVRGWIRGGYDESHPDTFPPEPALGSIDELRALCALDGGVLSALHDNYQDIYEQCPSFPIGVIRRPDGSPMPGGFWAGGQAYILNSRDGLRYAFRNWQRYGELQPRAMFVDTTSAVQHYESWEQGNTLTRSADERYKAELLRFYKERRLALGSEEGADFAAPLCDWFECRHAHTPGQTVPLWQLVYHDAAATARYFSGALLPPGGSADLRWRAADMLWGCMALLDGGDESRLAEHLEVDALHARIGAADMTDHAFIGEDRLVERTVFSTGVSVVANFADQPRRVDGREIPPGAAAVFD